MTNSQTLDRNQCLSNAKHVGSWAVLEALKILERIDFTTPKKGYILLETGFGPSGLPHIGTFAEVARTCMVIKSLHFLAPQIPTKLVCFSDDMDGLRKIPTNIPNREMLAQYLKRPLTKVPDPFGVTLSYGAYMNSKLREFLDSFGFHYEFRSSTECYQRGDFNQTIREIANNYQAVKDAVLKILREERSKTYSPFLPICPINGVVLEEGVLDIDPQRMTCRFINSIGQEQEVSLLDGNVKLQWKVDFAMRWIAYNVDFEMHGEDLQSTAEVGTEICHILKHKPPVLFRYKLFLDEEGAKISKSKGNGLTIDEWLKYANKYSLSYFLFNKPGTAKRLHLGIIPKAFDECVSFADKLLKTADILEKAKNPVWYITESDAEVKSIDTGDISFTLLLNLAAACNPENKSILQGFILRYDNKIDIHSEFIENMIDAVIAYYNDFIKPHKNFRLPNDNERKALLDLSKRLSSYQASDQFKMLANVSIAVELQNICYDIGNEYFSDLKDWFSGIYQVLIGQETGPRVGSFIALFGISETIALINEKCQL